MLLRLPRTSVAHAVSPARLWGAFRRRLPSSLVPRSSVQATPRPSGSLTASPARLWGAFRCRLPSSLVLCSPLAYRGAFRRRLPSSLVPRSSVQATPRPSGSLTLCSSVQAAPRPSGSLMMPLTVLLAGNHFIMGHGRASRHRVGRPRRQRRSLRGRTGRGPHRLRQAARVSVRTRPVISGITVHAA